MQQRLEVLQSARRNHLTANKLHRNGPLAEGVSAQETSQLRKIVVVHEREGKVDRLKGKVHQERLHIWIIEVRDMKMGKMV